MPPERSSRRAQRSNDKPFWMSWTLCTRRERYAARLVCCVGSPSEPPRASSFLTCRRGSGGRGHHRTASHPCSRRRAAPRREVPYLSATLRNRRWRECVNCSERPDELVTSEGTWRDGFDGKVNVSKGEYHRALDKAGDQRTCAIRAIFCGGKIKEDASRAPLMLVCTRVYCTSNLFLASRVVDEKP